MAEQKNRHQRRVEQKRKRSAKKGGDLDIVAEPPKERATRPKEPLREIDPGAIYRMRDGERLFGFKHSQLYVHINKGVIPKPIRLVEGGQARGWTGQMVIDHRRAREAAAMAEAGAPE